jgi:hypothetical protein
MIRARSMRLATSRTCMASGLSVIDRARIPETDATPMSERTRTEALRDRRASRRADASKGRSATVS